MLYDPKWEVDVKPKLEPWQEHLLRAAQYIRDHGWCQHHPQDDYGRVCIMGALYYTKNREIINHGETALKVSSYIDASKGTPPYWNDAPGRTKEDVIAALEGAAQLKE